MGGATTGLEPCSGALPDERDPTVALLSSDWSIDADRILSEKDIPVDLYGAGVAPRAIVPGLGALVAQDAARDGSDALARAGRARRTTAPGTS